MGVSVFAGIGLTGEMIVIQNVSRYCDDIYECVASNGVPPSVSRQMRVTVECTTPHNALSQCSLCLSIHRSRTVSGGAKTREWNASL